MEKRINSSMALDFLFTRTSRKLSWDVAQSPAGRHIAIRLRAVPFNITIVQAYVPTSDYDDNKYKKSMTSYRMSFIRHERRTFLLCKETKMQKWARMLVETGKAFLDPSVMMTQMREDSDF